MSLDTSAENAETKNHRSAITVICSDGPRIRVDLNLFPSEILRSVARSEFADCDETPIIFDSTSFLTLYNSYLPSIHDYLCLSDEAKIADIAIIVSTPDDFSFETMKFSAFGRLIVSWRQKKYLFDIKLPLYTLERVKKLNGNPTPIVYSTDIDFIIYFKSSGQVSACSHTIKGMISSDFLDEDSEENYDVSITTELKRSLSRTLTYDNNCTIIKCKLFLEWLKYQAMGIHEN
jgi:hypothetical protein